MLAQRIATALVLLALLLPALAIKSPWPFAALTLLAIGVAGWEWSRLNDAGPLSIALGIALGAACAAALLAGWGERAPRAAWLAATVAWVIGGALAIKGGVAAWPRLPRALRILIGLVALWTAWLALANAKSIGLNFILSILVIIVSADIAAYFGGRALGRRKLAPAISPGKSWEGVWSGIAGALVTAAAWLLVIDRQTFVDAPSFFAVIAERFGWPWVAMAVVFLVAMSVVGDLFESLVKRSAGAKDSSGLLPGHGGVLDRIDALLPAFPIALALATS